MNNGDLVLFVHLSFQNSWLSLLVVVVAYDLALAFSSQKLFQNIVFFGIFSHISRPPNSTLSCFNIALYLKLWAFFIRRKRKCWKFNQVFNKSSVYRTGINIQIPGRFTSVKPYKNLILRNEKLKRIWQLFQHLRGDKKSDVKSSLPLCWMLLLSTSIWCASCVVPYYRAPTKLREGNVFRRCLSVILFGDSDVTITHDALDLTVLPPPIRPPQTWNMGTPSPSPAPTSDI